MNLSCVLTSCFILLRNAKNALSNFYYKNMIQVPVQYLNMSMKLDYVRLICVTKDSTFMFIVEFFLWVNTAAFSLLINGLS